MKRRRWFELHSWLGVMSGLLMFVICWSGTVATLSREIDWLLDPAQRVAPRTEEPNWSAIEAGVHLQWPGARIEAIHRPLYPRFASVVELGTPTLVDTLAYVDPATGQVQGSSSRITVQRFFRSFHMALFDVAGLGYWIVSAFGFFLLVSLLAPLLFYKRWWQRFFSLKTGKGARVFWSEAHKLTGLWTWIFALVIALTGAWWTFEYAGVELGYPDDGPSDSVSSGPSLPLNDLVTSAHAHWPQLEIASIWMPESAETGALGLVGQTEAWLVRDRANLLYLDLRTGEVLQRQTAQSLGWPARWIDTVDPLHFGNFGGLPLKIVWFVLGLALSGLCLSGAWLHAQRLSREGGGSSRSRWTGAGAAQIVSVLVIAASVQGGVTEFRSYGPIVDGVQHLPSIALPVLIFVVGWIVLTVAIVALWLGLLMPRRSTRER